MAKITKIGAAVFIIAAIAATIVASHSTPDDAADVVDDTARLRGTEHDHDGDGPETADEHTDTAVEEPAAEATEAPADDAADEPAAETTEAPRRRRRPRKPAAPEATEEPAAEATEEPAAEATEEPAAEATEEPAEETEPVAE